MQQYIILFFLFPALTAIGQQPAPGGVAGAKYWLISQVDPAGESGWKDQISGQYLHPETTPSPSRQQTYLNFNPAYTFPASATGPALPLPGGNWEKQTLFTVYQSQDTFTEKSIWSYAQAGHTQRLLTTHRLADLQKAEYMNFPDRRLGVPTVSTYVQFQTEETQNTQETTLILAQLPPDFQLPISAFEGKLPEFILYNRLLSPIERQRVESYLALKYGTSLAPELDYLAADGKVIYSPERSGDFVHRLAGIGRDDLSGLYQKQSGSSYVPDQLIISAGTQAIANAANTTTLSDQHFLLWTDNNQAFDWGEKQALQAHILQHQWQVTATGGWAQIPTEVRFDTKWLRSPALPDETYWLVIDRSGVGDFSNQNALDYYPLTQLFPEGKAAFSDVAWDTDGSGKDAFTIAAGPKLLVQAQFLAPQCHPAQTGSLTLAAVGGRPPYRFQLRNEQGPVKDWAMDNKVTQQLTNLPPGSYTLLVTDADQREYRETFFFQPADAPLISLAQTYSLVPGQPLFLNASIPGSADLQYQWHTPVGQTIQSPELHITSPGTYLLLVDKQGCQARKTIHVAPAPSDNFRSVLLYPNPATDGNFQLRVHLEAVDDLDLRVFDAAGRLVLQKQFQGSDYYDSRHRLSAKGSYLLQLQSSGSQITLPLIAQ